MFPRSNLSFPGRKEFFLALISLQQLANLIEVNSFNPRILATAKFYLQQLEQKRNSIKDLDSRRLIDELYSEIEYYEYSQAKRDAQKISHWRNVYDCLNPQYEEIVFRG